MDLNVFYRCCRCHTSFGFIEGKIRCQYCQLVFCQACTGRTFPLYPETGGASPQLESVCDECHRLLSLPMLDDETLLGMHPDTLQFYLESYGIQDGSTDAEPIQRRRLILLRQTTLRPAQLAYYRDRRLAQAQNALRSAGDYRTEFASSFMDAESIPREMLGNPQDFYSEFLGSALAGHSELNQSPPFDVVRDPVASSLQRQSVHTEQAVPTYTARTMCILCEQQEAVASASCQHVLYCRRCELAALERGEFNCMVCS